MKKLLLSAFVAMGTMRAGVPAAALWDIRTTGSSGNAGCYVPGGGADYSQQNAAQASGSDLAVDAAVNTKVTSASHAFASDDVGNCIVIAGGSGWTMGTYYIVSVASNAAILDASPAATGTVGGVWKEGGALASLMNVVTKYAAGNTIYVKSGTYTHSSAAAFATPGTSTNPVVVEGYGAVHGDLGTPPVLTNNNATTALVSLNAANYHIFRNLSFSYTGASRGQGIQGVTSNSVALSIQRCLFDGVSVAFDGSVRYSTLLFISESVIRNTTSTSAAIRQSDTAQATLLGNVCIDTTGPCYSTENATSILLADGNIFARTGGVAALYSGGTGVNVTWVLLNNTFANNTGDGVQIKSDGSTGVISAGLQGNLFYGNGGRGVNITTDANAVRRARRNAYNAFGSNTGGDFVNWAAGTASVALTANPFTNASSGNTDFSLNTTSGGGAALRGANFAGGWNGIATTGHLDIGAAQSAGSGGGGSGGQRSYTFAQ